MNDVTGLMIRLPSETGEQIEDSARVRHTIASERPEKGGMWLSDSQPRE